MKKPTKAEAAKAAKAERTTTEVLKATADFFKGICDEASVDEATAKEIWRGFSHDMTVHERIDFIMEGRKAGVAVAQHSKPVKTAA